ncbi:MAG: T9SS type A sorting domain-containing protein [Bacteroidales bacterium]|jgi:hypothetical protein
MKFEILKYLFVLLIISICFETGIAQIKFQKIYSGNSYDYGFSVKQANDDGYFIFGNTSSFGSGNTDIIVIRTDKNGTPLWKKMYGSTGIDYGTFAEKTNDNNFLICGYTNNTADTSYNVLLMKIDTLGNLIWSKNYGGSDWDMGHCVLQASDLNYYIVGETYSYGKKNSNFYLIKTNTAGDTIYTKTYGGDSADVANSIIETKDGKLMLAGYTNSFGAGAADFYLIKINKNGDTLWTKTYGDVNNNYANSIMQCNDNGFALSGYSIKNGNTNNVIYFDKTDSTGNIQWFTCDYGEPTDQKSNYMFNTLEGNIGMIGYRSQNTHGGKDMLLNVFDVYNNWVTSGCYGGTKDDEGVYSQITSDSGLIIVGNTESFNTSFSSIFLVKTDKNYNTSSTTQEINIGINTIIGKEKNINVFPNPTTGIINISYENLFHKKLLIKIHDIVGRIVYSDEIENSASLDINGFPNGMYFMVLSDGDKKYTIKLIKE